jgi:hypothetical protein
MQTPIDYIKVEILKTDDVNPLDPNDKSGVARRVHEFEIGQVVVLSASKARRFIDLGWAKQVA